MKSMDLFNLNKRQLKKNLIKVFNTEKEFGNPSQN